MRLTIIEPEADGHHMVLYVRHIVREAIRRDWTVHLVTTEAASRQQAFDAVLSEGRGSLSVSLMHHVRYPQRQSAANLLRYQLGQRREFGRAYRSFRNSSSAMPDIIYVSNLDYIDKALGVRGSPFGPTPFAGLILKPRYHLQAAGVNAPRTRNDQLYRHLFNRMLRIPTLTGVGSIDESFVEYTHRSDSTQAQKVFHVPDMAALHGEESRSSARAALGIRDDQIVVLVYGQLSARKGVAELLAAAVDPKCQRAITIMLAGRQDDFVRATLAGSDARELAAQERLIVRPVFHNDEAEFRVHRAADIAWLGYRDFYGMSGALVQAGAISLPVIATSEGLVGWLTHRHRLGEIVRVDSPDEVASALNRLAADPALRAAYGAAGAALAQRHVPSHFAARICDHLQLAADAGQELSVRGES